MLRADIVDVIDARVPLKKAGKNFVARCPFHEEKTPSFTVSIDKQFYHCFGCGAHGTAIGFLMEYENMGFREAVEELAARAGLTVPTSAGGGRSSGKSSEPSPSLLAILQQADHFYRQQLRGHPNAQIAIEYLKRRGLSGQIAADFGVGYAPDGWDNLLHALGRDDTSRELLGQAGLVVKKESGGHYDRFRSRVMFPIHDYRGRVVGFGGRTLDDGEPKYLNSPETPLFHKGRELYGLFRARDAIKREQRALIVEGYMDVVALAQFGIQHAVATLGTATTSHHLERIFRFAPEVVFCFDGDHAGRTAAWRALENALPILREGRQVSFLFLPEGEDPDSLVRKEPTAAFTQRIQEAKPLPDFLFKSLGDRFDTRRPDGRVRLAELARPLLSKLPTGSLRDLMLERLASIVPKTDWAKLNRQVADTGRGRRPHAQTAARRTPSRPNTPLPDSPMRRAISLLLQKPDLVQTVPNVEGLKDLALPGVPLFCSLLKLARANPGLTTGSILEHYRETTDYPHLEKLLTRGHMIDDDTIETEFQDILLRLEALGVEQQLEALLAKDQLGGLDAEEKRLLPQLLQQQKHFQELLVRH